jgi:hypothetical protein
MSKDIQDRLGKLEGQVAKLEGHGEQLIHLKADFEALAIRFAALDSRRQRCRCKSAIRNWLSRWYQITAIVFRASKRGDTVV